jgi:Family of unknown function (DUF6527)
MKWVARFSGWLVDWLHEKFVPRYQTVFVEDVLPKNLRRRTLYVVQEDGFLEQAAMVCPCGCARVLQMNLLPDERPRWKLTTHSDGSATLHPSVWRQKDCRSHFWFRRGRIQWCEKTTASRW